MAIEMTMNRGAQLAPLEFIAALRPTLPLSSRAEGDRLVSHAKAWTTVYYAGEVPAEISERLAQLEAEWNSSRK